MVDAFLAAAREGRFEDLVAVLDPEIVLRVDEGPGIAPRTIRGAEEVAKQAFSYAPAASFAQPARVNGVAGFVVVREGAPVAVAALTVAAGRVVEMDILADVDRLARLDLSDFA